MRQDPPRPVARQNSVPRPSRHGRVRPRDHGQIRRLVRGEPEGDLRSAPRHLRFVPDRSARRREGAGEGLPSRRRHGRIRRRRTIEGGRVREGRSGRRGRREGFGRQSAPRQDGRGGSARGAHVGHRIDEQEDADRAGAIEAGTLRGSDRGSSPEDGRAEGQHPPSSHGEHVPGGEAAREGRSPGHRRRAQARAKRSGGRADVRGAPRSARRRVRRHVRRVPRGRREGGGEPRAGEGGVRLRGAPGDARRVRRRRGGVHRGLPRDEGRSGEGRGGRVRELQGGRWGGIRRRDRRGTVRRLWWGRRRCQCRGVERF
mmetsp:Transcript_17053/g.49220  ORF Transcript_17053/g.49220 Transcript_17053/m.49220 type:complete len:315 (-) Transcript_17053:393-1337(-)